MVFNFTPFHKTEKYVEHRTPNISLRKKISFAVIISVLVISFILLSGEIAVRVLLGVNYKKPEIQPPYDTAIKDEWLGWKMKPNYFWEGSLKDFGGNEYDVSIQYDSNGFKTFGDLRSGKPRVLFIGDSYTACIEVSNHQSFYNIIADSLEIEVFAYGHAGYGTLQEYLLMDQWLDQIQPDLIVWETCSNDFIDNYAPLEIVCGYKVGENRPYLDKDGKIHNQIPQSLWQRMQKTFYLLKWLEERWKHLEQKLLGKEAFVGEYYIATKNETSSPSMRPFTSPARSWIKSERAFRPRCRL